MLLQPIFFKDYEHVQDIKLKQGKRRQEITQIEQKKMHIERSLSNSGIYANICHPHLHTWGGNLGMPKCSGIFSFGHGSKEKCGFPYTSTMSTGSVAAIRIKVVGRGWRRSNLSPRSKYSTKLKARPVKKSTHDQTIEIPS